MLPDPELTIDDLRKLVDHAKASGISNRSVDDIFAEAQKVAQPDTNPSPALSPDVDARLIEERDAAFDGLLALIRERGDGEFTVAANRQVCHLIRRVASIDTARRGWNFHKLSQDELAWLQAQGVATG